jgi:hypothetical protein
VGRHSEEIVDDTISELSLENPEVECFTQDGDDLNLDKFLEQAKTFNEPSLKDTLEESVAQFEFDLDLDMICEQAQALLDPTPRMQTAKGETTETSFPNPFPSTVEPLIIENNKVEENEEQVELPPNFSNDKEVSTEAQSFVTISLETHHKTQVSFLQCLKVLSYAIIFKDLRTEGHKSRNNLPRKIRLSKKIGYLRWRNIILEGYQILKKK